MTRAWLWTGSPINRPLAWALALLLARRSLRPVDEMILPSSLTCRWICLRRHRHSRGDPIIAHPAHPRCPLDRAGTAYQEMAGFLPLSLNCERRRRCPACVPARPAWDPPGVPRGSPTRGPELLRSSSALAAGRQGGERLARALPSPLSLSDPVRDATEDDQLLACERSLVM